MDGDNPGREAGASWASATSQRAKKRRRDPSPQEETLEELSHSERNSGPSSQPNPPLPLHLTSLWPPSQPSDGTAPPSLGPIPVVQYACTPATRHQPLFPTPSVVWPPLPTSPATVTVKRGTPTYKELITRPAKKPATPPSVNNDLASISFEEQSTNAPSGSQQHPNLIATSSKPRLEDLPDPPADKRPMQTIRVLASAALQSEPKGKLTLEEMVDRISSRFEYFQDFQNRNKLKVRLASPSRITMLTEILEKY